MNVDTTHSSIASAVPNPQLRSRFTGRILTAAQAIWWIIFAATVGLNLLAIPANLQLLQRECVSDPCFGNQLSVLLFRSWLQMGLSREAYAQLQVILGLFPIIIFLSVGLILFVRKSHNPIVFFTSLMLVTFGGTFPEFLTPPARENAVWWIPAIGLEYIGAVMVITFFYIFPNGRFVPRWTRFIAVFWVIEQLLEILDNPPINLRFLPPGFVDIVFLAVVATAIYAQVYRYRRVQSSAEHRQTKWVVSGAIAALVGVVGSILLFFLIVPLNDNVVAGVILTVLLALFVSLIPISIGISILRAGLWDIDLIINRTLVYGMVTAILAGVLAVSSDLTKRFFLALTGESSELAPILATLIVVAAFEPLRKRIQHFVDQHVKYATGSLGAYAEELGKFLEMNDPDALARRFLKEALSSFRAGSGAIYLGQGTHLRLVTSVGEWKGHAELAVRMEHADRHVGLIALGARTNGEMYDEQDSATLKQMSDLVAQTIELVQNKDYETTPVSHRPENYRCPFCDIVHGIEEESRLSVLSDIVYRDEKVTALVASHQYPRNAPNILVVPNAHYENIFDLPPELGADIYRVAQQIAFALKEAYACDGISTRQHNEPGGSQDVWHYHLHVTPRFKGDQFYPSIYDKTVMSVEQRAEHATKLRSALLSNGVTEVPGGRANHNNS